jgi:ElaB/YqjD/DUF883 family membrane-anchored ribosome-binding protein
VKKLFPVFLVFTLLVGCGRGDLQDLAKDAETALRDAGQELDQLASQARGPLREAADGAMEAAADAREAAERFKANPTTETRQSLREAEKHLDDAMASLREALDDVPQGVRSAFEDALQALTDLRKRIEGELAGS